MTEDRPLREALPQLPWAPQEALGASQSARAEQDRTAKEVVTAFKEYAKAERLYRVALAAEIWKLKKSGVAVTACSDLARGDERIAKLKEDRDSAEGLKESAKIAGWAANADRRDVSQLIDWSQRRDLADWHGQADQVEPAGRPYVYGAKRAA